jgi:hypothetical protein
MDNYTNDVKRVVSAVNQLQPQLLQAQEPVAWIGTHDLYRVKVAIPTEEDEEAFVAPKQRLTNVTLSTDKHEYYGQTPLYTSPNVAEPRPKREWMGLTDDEIKQALGISKYALSSIVDARAIEAKLREKNA